MPYSNLILVLISIGADGSVSHPEEEVVVPVERQESQVQFDETRRTTLDWIDSFAFDQALFRTEDVDAIRAKVAGMAPKELSAWLEKTYDIRQVLESDDWREINEWLRDYIPTIFGSTSEHVEQFQKSAATMSPSELLELIQRIEQEYEAEKTADLARRAEIETLHRLARNNAWGRSQQQLIRVTRRTGRQQGPSSLPFFPRTHGAASRNRRYVRRYNLPLVGSREVAGIAVRRAIFGGRGYRW